MAATMAGNFDETFQSSQTLEIFSLNLGRDGYNMRQIGQITTKDAFSKVAWGAKGATDPSSKLFSGLVRC